MLRHLTVAVTALTLACGSDSVPPTENLGSVMLTGIWESTFSYAGASRSLAVAMREDSAGNLTGLCQWSAVSSGARPVECQGVSGIHQPDGGVSIDISDGVCFISPHIGANAPMSFSGRLTNTTTLKASLANGCGPDSVQFHRRTTVVPDGPDVAGAYPFVGVDSADATFQVTGTVTLGVPVDTSVLVSVKLIELGGSLATGYPYTAYLNADIGAIGPTGAFTVLLRGSDQSLSMTGTLRRDTLVASWRSAIIGFPLAGANRQGSLVGVRTRP